MSVPAVPEPQEIATLQSPDEAKALYDKIETLAQYAKRYGLDHTKQNKIAEAKLRTARKGGELLAATVSRGGKSKSNSRGGSSNPLPEGFSHAMSSRWQTLAWIPEEKWEASIAHAKETSNDELTLERMVRIGREMQLGGRSEKREKEARKRAKKNKRPRKVEVVDVHEWRPEGVSAIITDPPYVGDSIPLYDALRDFAIDVLPEGAPLVVMTWQPILPEVIATLRHPDLAYRWCICWRYEKADHATVDHARRVFDRWKPILVYHRGAMPKDALMFSDEITSPAIDKAHHEWGQSLEGFERLVTAFSHPGDMICDPFVGGGTTGLAALALDRGFIGGDISEEAVETTRNRLA